VEVVDSGVTGFLVSPNDVSSMSRYLDLLLTDVVQRRRMSQAARERMCQEFSVDAMVRCMTQVYEDVLAVKGLA
jgi:glycosyltransferase involved in cell wall biosynthesis